MLLAAVSTSTATAQTHPGAGVAQISWDQCAPLIAAKTPTAGPMVFYASVTGHSVAHQKYEIRFLLGDESRGLPDAWRFDPAGCNAGAFQFTGGPPPADVPANCPVFVPQSIARTSVSTFGLVDPAWGYSPGLGVGYLGLIYANGGAGSPNHDPVRRYLLGRFTLDHTWSVFGPTPGDGSACGGFERSICVILDQSLSGWTDLAGASWRFKSSGRDWITVKGEEDGLCSPGILEPPTPAATSTWGVIKAQYR